MKEKKVGRTNGSGKKFGQTVKGWIELIRTDNFSNNKKIDEKYF